MLKCQQLLAANNYWHLTFISMINTLSKTLQARKSVILWHSSLYEQLKVHAQFS